MCVWGGGWRDVCVCVCGHVGVSVFACLSVTYMCILKLFQSMADLVVERFLIMKKMRRIFTYCMLVGLRMTCL